MTLNLNVISNSNNMILNLNVISRLPNNIDIVATTIFNVNNTVGIIYDEPIKDYIHKNLGMSVRRFKRLRRIGLLSIHVNNDGKYDLNEIRKNSELNELQFNLDISQKRIRSLEYILVTVDIHNHNQYIKKFLDDKELDRINIEQDNINIYDKDNNCYYTRYYYVIYNDFTTSKIKYVHDVLAGTMFDKTIRYKIEYDDVSGIKLDCIKKRVRLIQKEQYNYNKIIAKINEIKINGIQIIPYIPKDRKLRTSGLIDKYDITQAGEYQKVLYTKIEETFSDLDSLSSLLPHGLIESIDQYQLISSNYDKIKEYLNVFDRYNIRYVVPPNVREYINSAQRILDSF
jgi:hypothetical protein